MKHWHNVFPLSLEQDKRERRIDGRRIFYVDETFYDLCDRNKSVPLPNIYKSLNFQEPKPLMWERIKYDDRFRKVFTKFSIRILFSTKTFKSKNLSGQS